MVLANPLTFTGFSVFTHAHSRPIHLQNNGALQLACLHVLHIRRQRLGWIHLCLTCHCAGALQLEESTGVHCWIEASTTVT